MQPLLLLPADQVRPGDVVRMNGRPETVVRVEEVARPVLPGRTVHLHTEGDGLSDPFLMRPTDIVHVLSRS